MTWFTTGATILVVAALFLVVLFLSARNRRLRELLEAANADLERVQRACARLAPGGVVQKLIADGGEGTVGIGAERKEVTALFVDVVGYTDLTERLDPGVLVRIMNGYYQRMSDAIHTHHGQVGSYLGDGIVAYFGALQPNPWQCEDAVRASCEMCTAIDAYNLELRREGVPELGIGIGIDFGSGVAALVGSEERREYSFLGRPVNIAARIQALTRILDQEILVTQAVREKLSSSFELTPMPPELVKGIAEPVVTYGVRRTFQ
jgi:adenylate cyclase